MSDEEVKEYLKFDVKFETIKESLTSPFVDDFLGRVNLSDDDGFYREGLVRSDPGGFVLTAEYARQAETLYRFKPRKSDVWLTTFPKSGTTWTQELLWLLVNKCDFETARKKPLSLRSPYFEFPIIAHTSKTNDTFMEEIGTDMLLTTEQLEAIPISETRVIKTHLPFYLLPPKILDTSKVVYAARNPKDVMVSDYYHHKLVVKIHNFQGDFPLFARYFMKDMVVYSPYFPHVLDAWSKRNHPNLLFIFYEDLKKNLKGEIKKMAAFLDRSLSDEELDNLEEHLSFTNFAKNPMVNEEIPKQFGIFKEDGHFIRKGKTGDWKNHFIPELREEVDRWIKNNLAGSDLTFVDELEIQN